MSADEPVRDDNGISNSKFNQISKSLEYAEKFRNKTFVIKFSGKVLSNVELLESVLEDVILLKEKAGINAVVLHGASEQISSVMSELGLKSAFIDGLRVTDKNTLKIVIGVLHDINNKIVWRINQLGGHAVGFSGVSGNLFSAKKFNEDLGLVGTIAKVNTGIVSLVLKRGFIPVVFSVGSDESGESLNINADEGASRLASALHADKLIIISDVIGLLDDPNDDSSLIKEITYEECARLLEGDSITGGMVPKIKGCLNALENGVLSAHIIGLKKHALIEEIFTDKGSGTMIIKAK